MTIKTPIHLSLATESSGHHCASRAGIRTMLDTFNETAVAGRITTDHIAQLSHRDSTSLSNVIAAPTFNHLFIELIIEMQAFEDKLHS